MSEGDDLIALLDEVALTFDPLVIRLRRDADAFVADHARQDGTIFGPNYADGPSEVLATLAAEQRFLVETRVPGLPLVPPSRLPRFLRALLDSEARY